MVTVYSLVAVTGLTATAGGRGTVIIVYFGTVRIV